MKAIGNLRHRSCDGVSRRDCLRIGALGMGGLALPQWLRAEEGSPQASGESAVIMVYLAGGPSHQDMWDIKEEAPSEIRGEFTAISTKVPGIRICEHFPTIAGNMDKFSILRSVVGSEGSHSGFQCETGHFERNQPPGGWPAFGAVLSELQGSRRDAVPPFLALSGMRSGGGFLGPANGPFLPKGRGIGDMTLNGLTVDRLEDRKRLLAGVDKFRRDVDTSGAMDAVDSYTRRAFDVITSSDLVDALDLNKEDPKMLGQYLGGFKGGRHDGTMRSFLTARRLVEAGARCVTLNIGGWDTHGQNFKQLNALLPVIDHGVGTMVGDLYSRGLGEKVSVVVWGEFGRTPKINGGAGRDHWPRVMGVLLAGGGMKNGQVIGSTDRLGGEPASRPVHVGEVFSTLYHNCGIDAAKMTLEDHSGRPQYLVDDQREPIAELI